MSLAIAYRSELLKTKRTLSFWLSLLGAGFIPFIFLLSYLLNPDGAAKELKDTPWNGHFFLGWQVMSFFLLPMFVVLLIALLLQIEFRNNTWKQVYAALQSYAQIYFSKLLAIHTMLLFFFVGFNCFMLGAGLIAGAVYPQLTFLKHGMDVGKLLELNLRIYIATLGIAAIQYWLSLRLKNFIAPIGVGLALLVGAIVATNFQWKHIFKVPTAHPMLTLMWINRPAAYWLHAHEWNALGAFAAFTLLGYLDLKYRKEKG